MINNQLPDATFMTRVRNDALAGPNPFEWKKRTTADIFGGKNVVLFALPGAFTPTCSTTHLPGYEAAWDDFKAQGVDAIICLAVNDAFCMFQWGQHLGAKKVFLLPDGNGEFTRKIGMLVNKSNLGFGMRSWRYSLFAQDGEVKQMFAEPGFSDNCQSDPFEVSDAGTMLTWLQARHR